MKKTLIIALLITYSANAAVRSTQTVPHTAEQQIEPNQPHIIYIPVPVPPKGQYTNEQQQRDLFLTFMSIAGNFGKILLNPDDTPHVIEGVNTIIDGVIHAAEIATKCSSRSNNYRDVVEAIALYIQEQAKLVQQQATEVQTEDDLVSAREQLLECALSQTCS